MGKQESRREGSCGPGWPGPRVARRRPVKNQGGWPRRPGLKLPALSVYLGHGLGVVHGPLRWLRAALAALAVIGGGGQAAAPLGRPPLLGAQASRPPVVLRRCVGARRLPGRPLHRVGHLEAVQGPPLARRSTAAIAEAAAPRPLAAIAALATLALAALALAAKAPGPSGRGAGGGLGRGIEGPGGGEVGLAACLGRIAYQHALNLLCLGGQVGRCAQLRAVLVTVRTGACSVSDGAHRCVQC